MTSDQVQDENGERINLYLAVDTEVHLPSGHKYTVVEFLGCGISGQVYRVKEGQTQEQFALKIGKSSTGINQLMNEMIIYNKLQTLHPSKRENCASLVDQCVDEHTAVIVLVLYKMNLYHCLKQRTYRGFPLSYISVIMRQISNAVLTLHTNSIIHTDLKPENIMITNSSQIKLIDFGAACNIDSDQGITQIPQYCQSRFYRSPEIIMRSENSSAQIDIWSLGCIMAELYLGLPIFAGLTELDMLQLMEVRLGDFPMSFVESVPHFEKFFDDEGKVIRIKQELVDLSRFKTPSLLFNIKAMEYQSDTAEQKHNFIDLLLDMLKFDPEERATIQDVVRHPFLDPH